MLVFLKRIKYTLSNFHIVYQIYNIYIVAFLLNKLNCILVLEFDTANNLIKVFSSNKIDANRYQYEKRVIHGWIYWIKYENLIDDSSLYIGDVDFFILHKGIKFSLHRHGIKPIKIYDFFYHGKSINNLWVFCDREHLADDNAEHLILHVTDNKNIYNDVNCFFILSKSSKHYSRLQKLGVSIIDPLSDVYSSLMHNCEFFISSQIYHEHLNKIGPYTKFIFLQHGITQNDISGWVNKKNIDLFVTSSISEFEFISGVNSPFLLTQKEVVLTGMPRLDFLYKNREEKKDTILICPTWRAYGNDSLEMNRYIDEWMNLLLTPEIETLSCHYKIVFVPHPMLQNEIEKRITIPNHIRFKGDEGYQELFVKTKLLITDYSSIAFDLSFLRTDMIYYQFDKDSFFNCRSVIKQHQLSFSYEENGFGPVVYNLDEIKKYLFEFINDQVNPIYVDRMRSYYKYFDGENSKRVALQIQKLR